jgi:putative holliday junction resolvase
MRILGIDYGDKKIGRAFGESDALVAVPLDVIQNKGEQTITELAEYVQKEDIDIVVIGAPLSTGGHHNSDQLEKTRSFKGQLEKVLSIPVHEEDESYTTTESIRLQKEEGAQAEEDAIAAMLIVRAYMEHM